MHAAHVGEIDRIGEIIEVKGPGGTPPYVVRFDNGHEGLVFPGPDAVVEPTAHGAAPDSPPNG